MRPAKYPEPAYFETRIRTQKDRIDKLRQKIKLIYLGMTFFGISIIILFIQFFIILRSII